MIWGYGTMTADTDTERLSPSNVLALAHLIVPVALCSVGLWLSTGFDSTIAWIVGQAVLGVFFFQCFILLHETAHGSFFRSRVANRLLGHLCGFLSVIPFHGWEAIHSLHHKWTGWRDRDPTTEVTVSELGPLQRGIVNGAWLLWVPLFTLAYRIGNYWSPSKLRRHLPLRKVRRIQRNQVALLVVLAVVIALWGEWVIANLGAAYLFSLVISDLFILSQHSHIDIPLAGDDDVQPIGYRLQVAYTRSLQINPVLARCVLLNFNLHEQHHARPGIPAYHLGELGEVMPRTRPFLGYVARAKRMKGVDFIFSTTKRTGVDL